MNIKKVCQLGILMLLLFAFKAGAGAVVLRSNIGKDFKITAPGTYQVRGTVTGNIDIVYKGRGTIIIEGIGQNPVLQGVPWGGSTKRAVGHVKGNIPAGCKLIIRNLTLRHNVHHIIDFGGPGSKHVYNCTFHGEEHMINGKMVFGVAPGNMGGNGLMENCVCQAGDDGHQVSLPNSTYRNNDLIMYDNGAAFQFGWNTRFEGRPHHADSIRVTGNIKPNANGRKNDDNNPGRCVIGGIFNRPGGDIKLTNLDLRIPRYNHLIKMVVGSVKIDDILIQGKTSSVFNFGGPNNLKAIAISAKQGGSIRDMVVDLGNAAANPANHFIKGDVDVTFLKSDGTATVYKGGKLQASETTPPSRPGAPALSNWTENSVVFSWRASTDNVGVTGYEVFVNGRLKKTVAGTSTAIRGLVCDHSYTFKVRAKDAAGNASVFSAARVGTSECSGTTDDFDLRVQAEDFRTMSGVDTESTTDNGGGENLGWINHNDWAEYVVDIPRAGTYAMVYRVAGKKAMKVNVFSNGNHKGSKDISASGGWQNWKTTSPLEVNLPAGRQTIRLSFVNNRETGFLGNFNWFNISSLEAKSASISAPKEMAIDIFPNPATTELTVKLPGIGKTNINMYDLSGREVLSTTTFSGYHTIALDNIKAGIYIVKVNGEKGVMKIQRVVVK